MTDTTLEKAAEPGTALALIVYMIVLLGIGLWAQRRAGSEEDFLLGGRALGPIVAGLAYAASTSSAWVLLGFTGFVATTGIAALWMVPGIIGGYLAVWLWLGPYLNEVSKREGHLTALDVIAGNTSPPVKRAIKIIASLMIVFCFSFYIAAQFQGAGAAISDVFGISNQMAIIVGALVILAYTFLGGFWAVSVTDTLQGLSISLIAVIVPIAAFGAAGGVSGIGSGLASAGDVFVMPFGTMVGWSVIGFILGLWGIGIGALGQPHLLTWLMAVRDRKARLQGAAVAVSWGVLVYVGMSVVALSARAMVAPGEALGEAILFDTARSLLPGVLPALVYAAILSAIMSTVDSQLLVASAAVSHDLGASKLAPGREVLITRLVIVLLCTGAVLITLYAPASIFDRVLFAWTALGAAFGPTVVVRTMGRTPHGYAIIVAMVLGFTLAVLFNQVLDAGPGNWKERLIPWIVGLVILFMFSKKREILNA